MKLSGWQRLWVVFSFVLGVIPVSLVMAFWPNEESIYYHWRFEALDKTKQLIWDKEGRSVTYDDLMPMDETNFEAVNALRHYRLKAISRDAEFQKAYIERVREVNAKYEKELDQLPFEQFLTVVRGFLGWVAVCLGFYALGWAIAWVIRGFRKPQA
ncbi:hypothetical protein D3879_16885 [Pseudomonas cavernicola]|uniref:Uncharacterized protein n=1 Tax=Pseudomonas cavernicola TaxID=2320866 RepID=A0A418XBN9_9PSED|nr:hypothetical protein [Pseudomonas cavernicola]RJG09743.1 hypothetical protein D3879_16885 [Pseudomonas cavernicola]